ncbi:MAG: IS982 family transposase [Rickettsiaceae bacterium]|nr:IS982 family transposase [Rickettsiaceae bacterium]
MKKCITTVFYLLDNFCKEYEKWQNKNLLPQNGIRKREGKLRLSELLTIVLYYYLSPCKDFKNYYLYYLSSKYKGYFKLPCYSRIVQLMPRLILPLSIVMQILSGRETGTYYIDSTKLQICHNKRTSSNRVFNKISKLGRSSYGWFMGFKLHMIINNKGEIMAIKISKENKSDLSAVKDLVKGLNGTIYGDKGYISRKLFEELYSSGLKIFTSIRKDMKNHLLNNSDKYFMRKRVLIECVFK